MSSLPAVCHFYVLSLHSEASFPGAGSAVKLASVVRKEFLCKMVKQK